jgi:hypothetical protein
LKQILRNVTVGLLVAATTPDGADGLEIYRIGGAELPIRQEPGVVFHQLEWTELEEQAGLDEEALAAGKLRPVYLNRHQNMAPYTLARGGGPYVRGGTALGQGFSVSESSRLMVDGDPATAFEWATSQSSGFRFSDLISIDLGGLFHIHRIKLFPSLSGQYPDRVDIAANPERQARTRTFGSDSSRVINVLENVLDTVEVMMPPSPARNLDMQVYRSNAARLVTIAEVEIYGEGYIAEASYRSRFIDVEEPAVWGRLRWGGTRDSEAAVDIRTRAGRDLDPNKYWRLTGRGTETTPFDENGRLLTATSYAQLKPGEESAITYDTDNWSFWTAPYAFEDSAGTQILSPPSTSVLQLRVDFASSIRAGGELSFLEFSATVPPLAAEVAGEIHPVEVVLGETVRLTYAIEPTIREQQSGFDRIEIATPFGFAGVDSVRIGRVPVEYEVRVERPDSTLFSVQLPRRMEAADSGELVEVVFRAPVLRYATPFRGWVRDSERPLELAQPIVPGEADLDVASEVLTVSTTFSRRFLARLRVEPGVLTPNGDGRNEQIEFSFDLLQLTGAAPVKLEIFDLAGRRVWLRQAEAQRSGPYRLVWDGLGERRELVVPGSYLYRLSVETGTGRDHQSGAVAVVY